MDKTLKCPKCGTVFEVDEADYAAIVNQVRTAEFEEELRKREDTLRSQLKELQKAQEENAQQKFEVELNKVKNQVSMKQAEIEKLEGQKQAEIDRLKSEKQKDVQLAEEKVKNEMKNQLQAKELSIKDKEVEINNLKNKIAQLNSEKEKDVQLAKSQTLSEQKEELNKKELEIADLKNKVTQAENVAQLKLNSVKEKYDSQLKDKDEMIEYYKDLKIKLSTKLLGETLEQHCDIAFNRVRAQSYPNAYFEKDNEVKNGTKGDFIFKDYATKGDKNEYISIMFEMKNEANDTEPKHKNEDFFKKLDKDRKNKECEYAVLVSTLERDNDFYNDGIADVSHRFPKMFVVRPQCFMAIIGLLCNAARNNIEIKQQLEEALQQDLDVKHFEDELSKFKKGFNRNFQLAAGHFNNTIKEIDKIIKALNHMKDELVLTGKQLNFANNKAIGLTVRSLTANSPTMKKKFEEARKLADEVRNNAEDVEEEEDLEEDIEIRKGDFGDVPEVEEFDDVTPAESFREETEAEKP